MTTQTRVNSRRIWNNLDVVLCIEHNSNRSHLLERTQLLALRLRPHRRPGEVHSRPNRTTSTSSKVSSSKALFGSVPCKRDLATMLHAEPAKQHRYFLHKTIFLNKLTFLLLVRTRDPQLAEHDDHDDQSDRRQSTGQATRHGTTSVPGKSTLFESHLRHKSRDCISRQKKVKTKYSLCFNRAIERNNLRTNKQEFCLWLSRRTLILQQLLDRFERNSISVSGIQTHIEHLQEVSIPSTKTTELCNKYSTRYV